MQANSCLKFHQFSQRLESVPDDKYVVSICTVAKLKFLTIVFPDLPHGNDSVSLEDKNSAACHINK